jgi:hypothetical protein
MTEQLINYAASLLGVTDGGGLGVKGFADLMLVLFGMVVVSESLMALYGRTRKTKKVAEDQLTQATQERILTPHP